MTGRWSDGALFAAAATSGLLAGLYYGFACAVLPGLARTDDRTFVRAMQGMNVAILNGWFLVSFLGGPAFTAVAAVLAAVTDRRLPVLLWTGAALLLHLGGLGITARRNVPLNNALAAAGNTDPNAVRSRFEAGWVRWHRLRTVVTGAAFGCLLAALLAGAQQ